ncbi:MAG TPA: epoxyqueuosine reductase QueH [Deltaproteobacteria bacterium]|nr:epoxyqueuosine reductase QueH [Deltaproteobacteria bacterium]HPR56345.1 epoxyqueuosine reductase QueH [Deltaproteobacteria bacterium]HXK46061.1 epoxyqueuosine reductase QueH [Deltaproteobacteria bacterium]
MSPAGDDTCILLHVCCAPCLTASVERLVQEGYGVILFFSNSNIHPEEEYHRRLFEARRLAESLNLELLEDAYDHGAWLDRVRGLEHEPERGKRCLKCFEFNLDRTAAAMKRLGLRGFTTTLTVSRHKSSRDIFAIGRGFEGFVEIDFKKKDGYARSVELSRQLELYRQGYCGCEFSLRRG